VTAATFTRFLEHNRRSIRHSDTYRPRYSRLIRLFFYYTACY